MVNPSRQVQSLWVSAVRSHACVKAGVQERWLCVRQPTYFRTCLTMPCDVAVIVHVACVSGGVCRKGGDQRAIALITTLQL